MKNKLMIIVLAISSAGFTMPSAFTEFFTSGYWVGEAKYYKNNEVDSQFFYAAEISADGKTFNTLTPPNADPEARFQRYALGDGGLSYSLRFTPDRTMQGILNEYEEQYDAWTFYSGRIRHTYKKLSDTKILIETYFGNLKHAEINLNYQGTGIFGFMWVGIAQMQYRPQ